MPSNIINESQVINRQALVYVHSHFQHFERTIKTQRVKEKAKSSIKNIISKTVSELNTQIVGALSLENKILKEFYPNETGDLRDKYKLEIKKSLEKSPLAQEYLRFKNIKLNMQEMLKQGYEIANKKSGKIGKHGTQKQAIADFTKKEIARFHKMLTALGHFSTNAFNFMEEVYGEHNLNKNFLAGTIRRIETASERVFKAHGDLKTTGSEVAIESIKTLLAKRETITTLGGLKQYIAEMNRLINATILEVLVGFGARMAHTKNLDFKQIIFNTLLSNG